MTKCPENGSQAATSADAARGMLLISINRTISLKLSHDSTTVNNVNIKGYDLHYGGNSSLHSTFQRACIMATTQLIYD